jgi:uncharacterized protein DUF3618
MTKSADELEREVEATRERLQGTLTNLQSRLTPASLSEDLVGIRDPSKAVNLTAERLLGTLRANPVPVLLICAGLGYLVYDAVMRAAEQRRLRVVAAEAQPRRDGELAGNDPDRLEDKLDEALEETFPGSDPVSVKITK